MYPVLIGSRALNYWNPDRKISASTDWDVISYGNHEGCEVHDPNFLNNREMTGYATQNTVTLPDGTKALVMSMLGLAIIKRSHLWRNLSFQKHITDYHKQGLAEVLSSHEGNFKIVKEDLQTRIALTKKAFPQGNPNLMQSKEDFFEDAVKKVYDHDWLHELYAHRNRPMYTFMQRDKSLAWCEKDMWDGFAEEEKLFCVAEEAYVIATERFLVPSDWKYPAKLAYTKAVDKICTTLCSGWFRDFAIDNYPKAVGSFKQSKVDQVKFCIINNPNERKYYDSTTK